MSKELLFCPLLTGSEEVKAMVIGQGDFVRPVLNVYIKEMCVAYEDGFCKHYNKSVYQDFEKTNYCPNCGCHMVEPQESEE